MFRREEGFTLIEILVVITIIAALVGMVTLVIPVSTQKKELLQCQNNLKEIGSLLVVMQAGEGFKTYNGAAFLLQVVPQVTDDNLKVFFCPGEQNADPARPAPNSPELSAMLRTEMDLKTGKVDDKMCSYAGPNFTDFPINPASNETRLWGCDKCRGAVTHHKAGIAVLYANSSKVDVIATENLEGHKAGTGEIIVGNSSPDKRLQKMTFIPKQ